MPRVAKPLTDTAIKTAKPKAKPYRLFDGQGLYIEVMPSGSKLWRLKYSYGGKEKRLTFGPYPTVSLAKARLKREEAKQVLSEGEDPGEKKKSAKHTKETTFQDLALEWYAYNSPRWAESTAYKANLYLQNDIFPVIGQRPITNIRRTDLVDLVRKVEARGTLNAAGKIRQWLNQVFRYGLAKGVVETNPATDLDVIAAHSPPAKHHPFVPFEQLPELLASLEETKCHMMTRHAVRLLLLTGARPGELRNAPWVEFDLENAIWTVPAKRMKMRRPHLVPLPSQAVSLLQEIQQITGAYPLVFAGYRPDRPMSENTMNKALRLAGYQGKQTGHGFRHLLSTELNNRGYNKDWIERQIAHKDKNEIRDTYNHATYLDQRRQMMQEWADSIDALIIQSLDKVNANCA